MLLCWMPIPILPTVSPAYRKKKNRSTDELAASFSRRLASCACCPYDNKYLSAFLRPVTPPILRCAARGARERGIISHNTILLTWPPMYSWLAKAIKWLAISALRLSLVTHPMSLSPSNRIRMSDNLYNRNIGSDEITDRLTAFPQHSHSGRPLQLEGGPHSGISASLHANLQALTERRPQMIAERTIPTVLPY